jgi:hypothetical protein
MTVRVGDVVLFKTKLQSLKFNQAREEVAVHPAIITRMHSESCLDLTVFFNGSNPVPRNAVFNVSTEPSWEPSWWEPRD